jgi:hypothetical protein
LARDEGQIQPGDSAPPDRTPPKSTSSHATTPELAPDSEHPVPSGGAPTSLYRAVGLAEMADIRGYGGFRQAPSGRSYEAKLFAGSFADAVRFGRLIQQRLPPPAPFVIVEVALPRSFVATLLRSEMGGMTAITVYPEQIAELNRSGRITICDEVFAPEVRS